MIYTDSSKPEIIREKSKHIQSSNLSIKDLKDCVSEVIDFINDQFTERLISCKINLQSILDESEGVYSEYSDMPEKGGGDISRFGIAWWLDANTDIKHLRFFGDRLYLTYVGLPKLFSFGIHPFYVVYPSKHPFHCFECRIELDKGEGTWQKNTDYFDLPEKVKSYFLCRKCQYKKDSMTNPVYDSHTGSISANWPPAVEPYYTTTITSSPPNPAWIDKDFHEYIAMKNQFNKYKELREAFQKYLAHKDAFEEYLEDCLFAAGFDKIKQCEFSELEGHGKIIGDHNNRSETIIMEATK